MIGSSYRGAPGCYGRGCRALPTGHRREPRPPYQPARGSQRRIARWAISLLCSSTPVALPRVRGPRRPHPGHNQPACKGVVDLRLQSRRGSQGGIPPRLGRVLPQRSPGRRAASLSHRAGLRVGRRHVADRQVARHNAARGTRMALLLGKSIETRIEIVSRQRSSTIDMTHQCHAESWRPRRFASIFRTLGCRRVRGHAAAVADLPRRTPIGLCGYRLDPLIPGRHARPWRHPLEEHTPGDVFL